MAARGPEYDAGILDPRRVVTFAAVAREGSFSRAAAALSLSQPAVSQQISSLETEVGTRLLDRRPEGLVLTEAGRALLEHAEVIAERLQLAGVQMRELVHGALPPLRIGAVPTALAGFVPAAVNVLRRQRPGAVIGVEEGTVDELPGRLGAGKLHVAVTFQDASAPRREPDELWREDIVSEPFLVALAAAHPLARRATVRLADLASEPWTAASRDGIIVRACRAAGFEPRLVSLTREQFAIRATVMSGAAVTLAPQLLGDAFAGAALRPIDGPAPARDVYALVPPGRRHPLVEPLLEALRAIAQQRVRRHKPGE